MISFNILLLCALCIQGCLGQKEDIRFVVKNITDCQLPNSDDQLKVETNLVEKNGEFVLNAALDLPFDVDNSLLYKVNASAWSEKRKSWRNFLNLNGVVCEGLERLIPKLWAVVAEAAKANVQCPLKAGHYELADFSIDGKQAAIPFAAKGRFLVESKALKDGKCIMCKVFEIEGIS